MPKCIICGERHYPQSFDGPAEPCICGHGVSGESAYNYAGLVGVWKQFKYRRLRVVFDQVSERFGRWLYASWD